MWDTCNVLQFCRTQGGVDANGALVQLSREGLGIHICHEGVFTGGLEMR